jgi:tetratricopeptide (TPR) repeat protein
MKTSVRDRSHSPQVSPASSNLSDAKPVAIHFDYEIEAMRRCELSKLFLQQGRYAEALDLTEQALALHPHDVESWYARAEALACLNRYDEALTSLEQAQELAGFEVAYLWVQKAVVLILLDQPQMALTCCHQALQLEPTHNQAWLFRGVALHRLGRFREAYRSYQQATQPQSPSTIEAMRQFCQDVLLSD